MTDFLKKMAQSSAERAALSTSLRVTDDFDKAPVPLTLGRFDIVAEIKHRSPAEGSLAAAVGDRTAQARRYALGGAAAISVLTEPTRFDGALEHLEAVASAVPDTPVMRKDFLVEPVQVIEARAAGASGVLLITTMLTDDKLREMLDVAYELGLFVLLESFDEIDLARTSRLLENPRDRDMADANRLLIGVNTRNLRTLEVDRDRLERLAPALPRARRVAESGLETAADAASVASLGYEVALVGSALMRSDDPAALIRAMREAGSARVAA